MRFIGITLIAALFSLPSFADYIRLNPPAPDSDDVIVADIGGVWHDGCAPRDPSVARFDNNIINILLQIPAGPCPAATTPWQARATIGPLLPGVYTVMVNVVHTFPIDPPFPPRATLVFPVIDAEAAFALTPRAGSTAGGTSVFVAGEFGSCPINPPCSIPEVRFGGVPAVTEREVAGGVVVTTPAHPAGIVDVEIRGRAGTTLATLPAAFTFRGSGLPDSASFTPLLIPLIFSGPGAHGSQWVTEGAAYNDGPVTVTPLNPVITNCQPNVSPCPTPLFAPGAWDHFHHGAHYPTGVVVWIPRDQADDLHFSLNVRDTSRGAENHGTEIPIIREEELLGNEVHLLDIPLRPGFRHTLRVYDLGFTESRVVSVNAIAPSGETLDFRTLTLVAGDETCVTCIPSYPRFAVLSDFVPSGPAADRMRLVITGNDPGMRLWAFVSVTNNETQQITTITPQ